MGWSSFWLLKMVSNSKEDVADFLEGHSLNEGDRLVLRKTMMRRMRMRVTRITRMRMRMRKEEEGGGGSIRSRRRRRRRRNRRMDD